MLLKRFYHEGLAQASYLVGCQATGEALVLDPNRDLDQYTQAAQQAGLRITAITETHIHADFVSGARGLAAQTGARLFLSDAGPAAWKYAYAAEAGATLLHDGAVIPVGRVRLEALHTPGHTPEHLAFLLTDTAGADQPMGLFTGDFVFVGDIGRPDLLETAAGVPGAAEAGARQLYRSLQRFRALPDYLQVWPGHGAGSACGRALGAVAQSTVGYEKRFNWALRVDDEATFVAQVLAGQPDPPPYFAAMKRVNRSGPAPRPSTAVEPGTVDDLQRWVQAGRLVIDLRPAEAYAQSHVRGAENLPWGPAFLQWAGWLLRADQPVGLIVEGHDVAQVTRELQLIGVERVAAYWPLELLRAARRSSSGAEGFERRSSGELRPQIARPDARLVLLDVRTPLEHAAGAIPGSRNIPLGSLQARAGEIPQDHTVVVYCAAGSRSPIAASLLKRLGWADVVEMYDGFDAWAGRDYPVAYPHYDSTGE